MIGVTGNKGGVGKSATSAGLAAGLGELGKKVLLVDFDSKPDLTVGLNVMGLVGTWEVIGGGASLREAVVSTRYFDVLPGNPRLANLDEQTGEDRYFRLKDTIARVRGYDYVVVDSAAGDSVYTKNVVLACPRLLLPVEARFTATFDIPLFLKVVERIVAKRGKSQPKIRVVLTKYHRGLRDSKTARAEMDGKGYVLCETVIRQDEVIPAAFREGERDVISYRPRSKAAADFRSLAKEVSSEW